MTALAEIQGHTFYLPALGPDSMVFDLGASGGHFALEVQALTGCRCHTAEASPSAFEVLPKADRVSHHHVAIAGKDGPVRMEVGGREGGRFWVKAGGGGGSIEVPGLTLRAFMERCGVESVDLVKLDIEGAEFDMFDAADDDTLRRVGQLSVEFHDFLDPALTPRVGSIVARLERLGFEAIVMTRRAHGDVLFLNRARLGVPPWKLVYMRTALKYGRGIGRILSRHWGNAA